MSAVAALAEVRTRSRTPVLDAWRAELAANRRTPTTFDALWRAACAEAHAMEAEALRLPVTVQRHRRTAAAILRNAA